MTMGISDPRRFLNALRHMGISRYVSGSVERMTLARLSQMVESCTKCALSGTRRQTVFGEGSEKAELLFIGEAPGEEEDRQGRPFVGRAGKLLDQMIDRIGMKRPEVFICNVLKCRPPHNRDPEAAEAESCKPYLLAQIDLIGPRVICTLGKHAYNTLLGVDERITRVRGRLVDYKGITLLPTYHPSFLLRNQSAIRDAYEDMEKLKELLQRGSS
jgi:uracil-DNA glycosylase family 4